MKRVFLKLLVSILLLSTVLSLLNINIVSAEGLDASISIKKAKITVWYFDADGKPLQGIKAILNEKTTNKVEATGVSDASGKVVFDGINEGKYLLVTQSDKYMTVPSSVDVPTEESGAQTYNVEIRPKMEEKTEVSPTPNGGMLGEPGESEKPKPPVGQNEPKPVTPSDPKLPQTGIIRWHMYALLGVGLMLFMAGWLIVMLDGKNEKKRVA